jgi:hypothetical protein
VAHNQAAASDERPATHPGKGIERAVDIQEDGVSKADLKIGQILSLFTREA